MGRLLRSQVATCGFLGLKTNTVMKVLVAICCLAISVRAQVGPSGIVNPDGTLIQFTAAQADNIALIGPSGIVTKDGSNAQLPSGQDFFSASDIPTPVAKPKAALPTGPLIAGLAGPSGIVSEKGNTQFTREFADNIAVVGPSGAVTKDGRNVQFRTKRSAHTIGASGMILADGTLVQLNKGGEDVHIVLEGPSGLLMSDGTLVQKRAKRSAHNIGASGIILADGTPVQLIKGGEGVHIVLEGPSGLLLSDGTTVQKRAKRSAHNIGSSGIILADGTPVQLIKGGEGVHIVLEGPSGLLLSDGTTVQKRAKRSAHNIGPSGIILADGTPVQLVKGGEGVYIVEEGPSGIILSDGTLIQKRAKRSADHLVGASGIITNKGQLIQLPAGVTIVSAGPSGIVLSNGQNIQLL